MRPDMHKVIVERPRRGSRMTNVKTGARYSPALIRTAMDQLEDFDGGGCRHPGHVADGKALNENLAPLRRFLERQVGRPWDKVYSEIRAGIDTRSAIGLHVMQHLPDMVQGVSGSRFGFAARLYIDNRTGLLRRSRRDRPTWWDRRPDERESNYVHEGPLLDYVKEDGVWYRVEYRANNPDELVQNEAGRWVLAGDRRGFKPRTVTSKAACDNATVAAVLRGSYVTNRKYYERTQPQSKRR